MTRNPSPRDVLTPWQRPLVKVLLVGFVVLAGTGIFLARSDGATAPAAWALLLHVIAGVVLVPVLLAFAIPHGKVQLRRKPVIGFTGLLVTLCALGAAFTGAALALQRAAARPSWTTEVHVLGGFGLIAIYALHRRFGSNPAPWRRLAAGVAAVVFVGALFVSWEAVHPESEEALAYGGERIDESRGIFGLSRSATATGTYLPDSSTIDDSATCGECHPVIFRDWQRSAHRHASMTNPFYRGTIEAMRDKYPLVDTKWCSGCHDPALLFTDKMDDEDLDFESNDARVGLSCVSCHAIDPQSQLGNGDYVLQRRRVYAWEKSDDPAVRKAHDVLLRMKPEGHAKSLTPSNIQTGEFCSLCHKAEVPPELNRWKWFRAQNEYDAWHDSGVSLHNARSFYHPEKAKSCRDCHMPLVLDPEDPAADEQGYVRSHLFAAANTGLPYLRGDQEMIEVQRAFLAQALRVDITGVVLPPDPDSESRRLFVPAQTVRPAVKPGEIVEAHVVVRNLGVGHRFPGGTIDSNEVWVEFKAAVGDGEPFYVSGAIDEASGRVDPSAEFYRAYVMDQQGQRVVNRVGPDVYTRVYVKTIGPGTADVVRYRFRVPEGGAGALKLTATVRYRKFMREYIDFLFPEGPVIEHRLDDGRVVEVDLSKLPIIDMAWRDLELPITAEGTPGAPPVASDVAQPQDKLRVNDLAIAYLLQGEPHAALALFKEVTLIDPSYADGWVNVGRALFAAQDHQGALKALGVALRLKPGWGKAHFFEGAVHRSQSRFRRAKLAFEGCLKEFPQDRAALRGLADVLWELERPKEALAVLDRLFAIDPEDWMGWRRAVACYKDLGDKARLRAAEVALQRFKRDDDEPKRAGVFRNQDIDLQRMAQPVHVHEQAGLE